MTRSITVPKLAAHLDLLASRARSLETSPRLVRLVELERHVLGAPRLGWRRDDDVSSALIPQFYFDYLRGGPTEPLGRSCAAQPDGFTRPRRLSSAKSTPLLSEPGAAGETQSLDLSGYRDFCNAGGEDDRRTFGVFSSVRDRTPG